MELHRDVRIWPVPLVLWLWALRLFCVAAGDPKQTDNPIGTDKHFYHSKRWKLWHKKCCRLRLGSVQVYEIMHLMRSLFSLMRFWSALAHYSRQVPCHLHGLQWELSLHHNKKVFSSIPFIYLWDSQNEKNCFAVFLFETCIVWSSGSANMAFLTVPAFTSGGRITHVSAVLGMASIFHSRRMLYSLMSCC